MGKFVVTGGATGIGAAVVETLKSEGHAVIVVDIKDGDVCADLAIEGGRQQAVKQTIEMIDEGLDGLVVCAGVGPHFEPVEQIVALNFFGAVQFVQGLQEVLATRKGAVVLVSSNTAVYETDNGLADLLLGQNEGAARDWCGKIDGQSAYATAKYSLAVWMRTNIVDYALQGIRMNAVAPGFTRTALTDAGRKNPDYGPMIEEFIKTIPVGFEGKPNDIAAAICFLLRREASYVCGSVLFVDGGHDASIRPAEF